MNQMDALPTDVAVSETEAPTPAPTLRRLFLGDDGLRAGWSLLLFFAMIFAVRAMAVFFIHHFHLLPKPDPKAAAEPMGPRGTIFGDGLGFIVVAAVAWVMSLIERRRFVRYGLPLRRMAGDFLAGLGWGLVCLSLLIAALYFSHTLAFDGVALHGRTALIYGAEWFLGFFCVGLTEEFVTRGYIQYTVARGVSGIVRTLDPENGHSHAWGFWVAAFLFSVCLFMLGHIGNPGETLPGIIAVGLAGTVFAFSLWRTGSLWWAIGIHTSWDWAQSYFYGVHDSGLAAEGHLLTTHPMGSALLSGGSTGPEGSLFVIPTLLLIGAIIHYTLPRRSYPLTPDQMPVAGAPIIHGSPSTESMATDMPQPAI